MTDWLEKKVTFFIERDYTDILGLKSPMGIWPGLPLSWQY